ncbi:hypothetical protein, partial [Alistipes sp.]|uniref:hypothetical protein n=1 Tax=Alistipes sp. TaxID=1872444 RepID=UPI0025C27A49
SLVRIQSPRLKKRLDNQLIVKPFSLLRLPFAAAVEHKWNTKAVRRFIFCYLCRKDTHRESPPR